MKSTLSPETIDFVKRLNLGFVVTVRPDGKPSLSHKGSLTVLDENHLIFADNSSLETVQNLKQNSNVVVEMVDFHSQKSHRFHGKGKIIPSLLDTTNFASYRGLRDAHSVKNFVLIEIKSDEAVISPASDRGLPGPEFRKRGKMCYNNLWKF